MNRHLRRLSFLLVVAATALAVPSLASASSAHHRNARCRAGYHQKTTRAHHKRHVICVKNKHRPTQSKTSPSQSPTTPPPTATGTTTPATTGTTTAPVTAGTTAPPVTSAPPATMPAPPSGPPTPPSLGGPPPPALTTQNMAAASSSHLLRAHTSSASAYVGQAYAADVTTDGALSAWDFIGATGTNHEAGYIDISPSATPGSAFSSQWVAAREWMYSYSLGRWMTITNFEEEVVSQPNPNIVTVGDTSGSPFRFNGLLGAYGWVYIDTEYWWWTGSQWTGGTFVPTTNYTQSYSVTSRTTGNTWGYLS